MCVLATWKELHSTIKKRKKHFENELTLFISTHDHYFKANKNFYYNNVIIMNKLITCHELNNLILWNSTGEKNI